MKKVLVTGGAGYIGSHTLIELFKKGYEPLVIDNLSNSRKETIKNIENHLKKNIPFFNVDLVNYKDIETIFKNHQIDCVIHFAGKKSVPESILNPFMYYRNNVVGTLNLVEAMNKYSVKKIVFSSSAAIYGNPKKLPIYENMQSISQANPYGSSKYLVEKILEQLWMADKEWSIINLRYFNPIGADRNGVIGEDPLYKPTNLMPLIMNAATYPENRLDIFGNNYRTPDGTCIRDFIHVVDLAKGHIKALDKINEHGCYHSINLGTGKGISILELIKEFEYISGKKVNYNFSEKREGDVPISYADVTLAKEILKWESKLGINEMCIDAWNWHNKLI